ncbi:hypothetical protein [Limnohabitans planktonicus]|uniref:hypothetical protein n=1 Tax=Limnohabitans planktonicus TaxID=540060 RepID=UPI000AD562F7|nr:hypothetical protein [Limnohabitans planktonicus]
MSTQENLSQPSAQQPLLTALLALSTLLLVKQTSWIWGSLYFQHHTLAEVVIALGLMLVWVIAGVALLRLILGQAISYKVTNVGIALVFSLVVFRYLQQIELIPAHPTTLHKTLALASGLAAGLLTLKIRQDIWKRLHLAVIVGGLIFTLLPVVLANTLAPTVYWPSPSDQPPTQQAPKLPAQNTIVLLLDEFSASAAGPVVDQLKDAGLHVTSTSIDPAGKNTINVIPAIWTRSNFDQSVACGPTQLCSASHVLDFAKVRASSANIDIVGFFHRYCSIQGLRSCSFPVPTATDGSGLACSFPGLSMLEFLGCDEKTDIRALSISMRDSMQNSLLEAPFWQKGGILFAHLLVPHPLMGVPMKSLSDEYTDNIANGARLVKLVAQKAKLVFGNDFKIIIFSDHPLRPEIWCAGKQYIEFGCTPDASQISTKVPLIIATPSVETPAHKKIKKNQAVFDLLFK